MLRELAHDWRQLDAAHRALVAALLPASWLAAWQLIAAVAS